MPELRSQFLFTFSVGVSRLLDLGATPYGTRHVDMLGPGTFEGPDLEGTILPGGMDHKLLRGDGTTMPDVRMVLETGDGALIFAAYRGLRHGPPEVMQRIAAGEDVDPGEYYLRIALSFETGSEAYRWLNSTLAVGVGRRLPERAEYDVFAIL